MGAPMIVNHLERDRNPYRPPRAVNRMRTSSLDRSRYQDRCREPAVKIRCHHDIIVVYNPVKVKARERNPLVEQVVPVH
jgi:hypothetical protein